MKIEIGEKRPENFAEYWPGQYDIFHHLEYAWGIPNILFAITTRKENGKANVNFHAWSSFSGDGKGFYAVVPGVLHHSPDKRSVFRLCEPGGTYCSRGRLCQGTGWQI